MITWTDGGYGSRVAGMVGALAAQFLLAALFLWGLTVRGDRAPAVNPLSSVTLVELPPPKPEPIPVASQVSARPGPPALEGLAANAASVEAPAAPIVANPAPAAPNAGEGAGSSDGSGNAGIGADAGGSGAGTGGGGVATPARWIVGELRNSDYPRAAEREGLAGMVAISFRVRTDGRVDRCIIVQSSGHALLDDLTCDLFTQRYRFQPAMAADGRPVETTLQTNFTWGTRRR